MRLLVFGGWGQLGSDLALAGHCRRWMARLRPREVDVTEGATVALRWPILLDTRSAELVLLPSRSWEETLEWYLAARPRLPAGRAAEGSE
jgi:hypothetical protein